MTTPLDELLNRLSLSDGPVFEEGKVYVKLMGPAADLMIVFEHPDPDTAKAIKEREGDAYAIPIRIRLVNRSSGKEVRGFNTRYLHPWWVRKFVFNIAAAVAFIEREWDVMSAAYIEKMEQEES